MEVGFWSKASFYFLSFLIRFQFLAPAEPITDRIGPSNASDAKFSPIVIESRVSLRLARHNNNLLAAGGTTTHIILLLLWYQLSFVLSFTLSLSLITSPLQLSASHSLSSTHPSPNYLSSSLSNSLLYPCFSPSLSLYFSISISLILFSLLCSLSISHSPFLTHSFTFSVGLLLRSCRWHLWHHRGAFLHLSHLIHCNLKNWLVVDKDSHLSPCTHTLTHTHSHYLSRTHMLTHTRTTKHSVWGSTSFHTLKMRISFVY